MNENDGVTDVFSLKGKKILIITEKYDVALKISTILSNGSFKRERHGKISYFTFEKGNFYTVVGLHGHVIKIDFEDKHHKWELEKLVELVHAEIIKKFEDSMLKNLISNIGSSSDYVVIATDYDREGELIGTEVLPFIKSNAKIRRAKFSSLTHEEVMASFSNLIGINWNLANAAETRQIVDLVWGATLTRYLSLITHRNNKSILSIGRVQGPTLALIVNRYKLIQNFVPEPLWYIDINFEHGGKVYTATHANAPFKKEEESNRVIEIISNAKKGIVKNSLYEEYLESPPAPFNTTAFLVDSTKIGFSAGKAMKIAESLYTSGYISYPRTDNTVYPKINFRNLLNKIESEYFEKEINLVKSLSVISPTRGKVHATDHPPIYPVDKCTKKEVSLDAWKIYELVMRRFLATLYKPAKIKKGEITIEVKSEPFNFRKFDTLEPGWYEIYTYYQMKKNDIPILQQGEIVEIVEYNTRKEMTKAPSMYTQASLITEMEKLGLGTKSTRHEIIDKLFERKYIEYPKMMPSLTGIAVIDSLEKHATIVTLPDMTAHLEEEMNKIEENGKDKEEVIAESRKDLLTILNVLIQNKKDIANDLNSALTIQHHLGLCPLCKGELVIRYSNKKQRFLACSNYPQCRYTHSLPQTGTIKPSEEKCELCGSAMITLYIDKKAQLLCLNNSCENSKMKIAIVGKCPSCGNDLVVRHSYSGKKFVGCTSYPSCKVVYPLPQNNSIKFTGNSCPICKAPMIKIIKGTGSSWETCINPDCPSKKKEIKK
jgi:DNA topoisomerase-1